MKLKITNTGNDLIRAFNDLVDRVEKLEMAKAIQYHDVPLITEIEYENKWNTSPTVRDVDHVTVKRDGLMAFITLSTKKDVSMRMDIKTYQITMSVEQMRELAIMIGDELASN